MEINSEKPVKKWAKEVMGKRYEEALASIEQEKVTQETVFYFELYGRKFLAFYIEGDALPPDMTMQINRDHRNVMDQIKIKKIKGKLIYSIN